MKYMKKMMYHDISEQIVKFLLNWQLFFIYILNYQMKLGKILLLIKFCQSGDSLRRGDRLAEEDIIKF